MKTDSLVDKSCWEFMSLLSTKAPVPGGGGAAAMGGALGVGLANMVVSLTVGKPKYAQYEEELQSLLAKGLIIQDELMRLVEKDAVVFAPLAMAYKLPSTTEAEREAKAEELALAARDAALVPMEIAEKTFAAMEITKRISEIGTRLAISDAGCAMHFLKAALWSARYNVLINLPLVNDERFSKMTNDKLNYWFEEANKLFSETIENVEKYL